MARSGGQVRGRAGAAATSNQLRGDFRLRPAEESDYSFALALYLEGAKEHLTKIGRWDEDRFAALFRDGYKQGQTQIVSVDSRVVGFIQMVDFADRLYLRQIHLIDGFRGRGIGSTLIGAELKRGAESDRPVTLGIGEPFRELRSQAKVRAPGLGDLEPAEWSPPCESGHVRWGVDVWYLLTFNGMVGEGRAFLVDLEEKCVVRERDFQFRAG